MRSVTLETTTQVPIVLSCIYFHVICEQYIFQVAMKALGFDVKKAEVLKLLKDYDRDGSGNMYWDDFFDIS